jgi:hypothetical protein
LKSEYQRPLGDRRMGVTMTDSEWKERRREVERFRLMATETTDPVATALLLDIVFDLEADLNELVDIEAQGLPQCGEAA